MLTLKMLKVPVTSPIMVSAYETKFVFWPEGTAEVAMNQFVFAENHQES